MSTKTARVQAYFAVAQMNYGEDISLAQVVAVHRGAFSAQITQGSDVKGDGVVAITLATPGNCTDHPLWPPVVGDWVALADTAQNQGEAAAHAVEIMPRTSYIERPAASGFGLSQAIAANVDELVIVEPLQPAFSIGRVERFVAIAHASAIRARVVLTKADLVVGQEIQGAIEQCEPLVESVTALNTTDTQAVAELKESFTPGDTLVLVGRSGAGKSTLTNALLGTSLATGKVRAADGKGRHTTTSRQLLQGEVNIIDTPGIRALGATPDAEAVDQTFTQIAALAEQCRYRDCSHSGEPGCAVGQALTQGDLSPEVLERYQRMRRESERNELNRDARLARQSQRAASRDNTRGRRETMRLKGRGN